MAGKFLHAVVHEVRKAIPPAIFFLAVFHLALAIRALMLHGYDITPTKAAVATVLALTLAKAILVVDALPFMRRFQRPPLIAGILWRTSWYALLCLAFRALEELIPIWFHHGFAGSLDAALVDVTWPHFWASFMWLALAVLVYDSYTALDRHFGAGSFRRALFSREPSA